MPCEYLKESHADTCALWDTPSCFRAPLDCTWQYTHGNLCNYKWHRTWEDVHIQLYIKYEQTLISSFISRIQAWIHTVFSSCAPMDCAAHHCTPLCRCLLRHPKSLAVLRFANSSLTSLLLHKLFPLAISPCFLTSYTQFETNCENYSSACEDSIQQTDFKQLTKYETVSHHIQHYCGLFLDKQWSHNSWTPPADARKWVQLKENSLTTRKGESLQVATSISVFYTPLTKIRNLGIRFRFEIENISLCSKA